MTTPIFRTKADSEESVEIAGVGFLGAGGKGGVVIEEAAQNMAELQEKDAEGRLVVDEDGNPKPLSGAKLQAAAKEFAESRGLVVQSVSDEKLEGLPLETGRPPDRPPAREVVLERAANQAALLEAEQHRTEVALEPAVEPAAAKPEGDEDE